jgi:hypothetical protein
MPDRSRKRRPRDPNQLAKLIVDIATGQVEDRELTAEERGKNPAAVALGRLGGLKGGKARAKRLRPEERVRIAREAAAARWKKDDG